MKKLTPWFKGSVKPVNIGVYQNGHEYCYQYWNGEFWGLGYDTPEGAALRQDTVSIFQNDGWRGLAVKPKSGISSK